MTSESTPAFTIERALAFWRRRRDRAHQARARRARRRPPPPRRDGRGRPSFRSTVDLRLTNLERQLDEVKGRVNGLLFLLAGAVATQVVLRLFA